ncbi:MAG: TCR/Tet family MFS transporter [Cytophagales bacterium]|nr:TCR/Tet family MFS transporter [Cytophaga sp.]
MPPKRNAALAFIFVTLLIDVIGFGIIIPVTPKLIEELTGEGISAAAQYGGWLTFVYAITQFFFAPILGALSDRYGRRPVLLFSLFGLGIDYIFMAFSPTLAWLFIGRFIAGIAGASFTTATAYIADISEPEKRAQNFGLVGAAFGLGFIIGPVIGGLVSDDFGSRAPFVLAAVLTLVNVVYGYFFVPESLSNEHRRPFEWTRANPFGVFVHLKKYPLVSGLISTMVLLYIASHAVQSNWTYYTMLKFDWDEKMVGYSLGFVGLMIAVVQGGLIRIVIPKLGQNNSVYIGLSLSALGLLLFGLANQGWMMFAILLPYALGGISGPSLQGIMSAEVPVNEQGELQGALTGILSLTSIVGPPLMNNMFAYFTSESAPVYFPAAPFIAGAIMIAIGTFLCSNVLKRFHIKGKKNVNPVSS